ncbi:MAG: serine/threonine protein kinase [Bacillota bacterium]
MSNNTFLNMIENELFHKVILISKSPYDPIVAKNIPKDWKCLGTGNYAAVFSHKSNPNAVVKVYGRSFEALEKEANVYTQLGIHPAFSNLLYKGQNYLVLKRLDGITLYDAIAKGIKIPESVIVDIDQALTFARSQGLNPYDVHGKNVMMKDGRGYVVDISDFYKEGQDEKWDDLVKAYYKIYKKTLYKIPVKIPYKFLDFVRYSYRTFKKIKWKVEL